MPIDYDGGAQPQSEAEWRAESDANTLARAEAIKADTSRHDAAKDAARRLLDDEKQDVVLLAKVAGRKAGVRASSGNRTTAKGSVAHNVFKRI